jgi:HEPN domain-containing protein
LDIKEKIEYWVTIEELDIPVMEHLFDSGDYMYSLFIGHLIIEKILKAHYVKNNLETPPKIHDLVKLANSSGMVFEDSRLKYLLSLNAFNIEARYPEEKLRIYKLCSKEFCKDNIVKIKELFTWLKSLI